VRRRDPALPTERGQKRAETPRTSCASRLRETSRAAPAWKSRVPAQSRQAPAASRAVRGVIQPFARGSRHHADPEVSRMPWQPAKQTDRSARHLQIKGWRCSRCGRAVADGAPWRGGQARQIAKCAVHAGAQRSSAGRSLLADARAQLRAKRRRQHPIRSDARDQSFPADMIFQHRILSDPASVQIGSSPNPDRRRRPSRPAFFEGRRRSISDASGSSPCRALEAPARFSLAPRQGPIQIISSAFRGVHPVRLFWPRRRVHRRSNGKTAPRTPGS